MAATQPLQIVHTEPLRTARPISRNNVIPFRAPRVLLPVTFMGESSDATCAQLRALLHSPLGVYVTKTERVRNAVRVQFDIAPDDLDFTLHTLLSTLPQATIGRLSRRTAKTEAC
jgi:hypothetical protein